MSPEAPISRKKYGTFNNEGNVTMRNDLDHKTINVKLVA